MLNNLHNNSIHKKSSILGLLFTLCEHAKITILTKNGKMVGRVFYLSIIQLVRWPKYMHDFQLDFSYVVLLNYALVSLLGNK